MNKHLDKTLNSAIAMIKFFKENNCNIDTKAKFMEFVAVYNAYDHDFNSYLDAGNSERDFISALETRLIETKLTLFQAKATQFIVNNLQEIISTAIKMDETQCN
jgi:recombinational DNA repair ATPase RecF